MLWDVYICTTDGCGYVVINYCTLLFHNTGKNTVWKWNREIDYLILHIDKELAMRMWKGQKVKIKSHNKRYMYMYYMYLGHVPQY